MHTVTVLVKHHNGEPTNTPESFWANAKSVYERAERPSVAENENRIWNQFPRLLAVLVQGALTIARFDTFTERSFEPEQFRRHTSRSAPLDLDWQKRVARIAFRVEDISYGSQKIELSIPDVDAVLEVVGNNVDLFEALLDEYVPEAFGSATDLEVNQFTFRTTASSSLSDHAARRREQSQPAAAGAGQGNQSEAKQVGAQVVGAVIRSPLIFPVILIFFLWYIARQDTLAERQILSGLMQSVMQQQTATLAIIRDVGTKEGKQSESQRSEKTDVPSAGAGSKQSADDDKKNK